MSRNRGQPTAKKEVAVSGWQRLHISCDCKAKEKDRRSPVQRRHRQLLSSLNDEINSIDLSDYYKMHMERKRLAKGPQYKLDKETPSRKQSAQFIQIQESNMDDQISVGTSRASKRTKLESPNAPRSGVRTSTSQMGQTLRIPTSGCDK